MEDEDNVISAEPQVEDVTTAKQRRNRRLSQLAKAREAKAKKAKNPAISRREEVAAHEAALKAAGLLDAAIPEAEVLKDAAEETLAKLTREEKDKVSLAEALARAAEIATNDDGSRSRGSEFHVDASSIPHGWHYEWRRDTVLNQRDPSYLVSLAKAGWRAVPRHRHPEMMPSDWPGDTIVRGGTILMEIPKVVAEQRKSEALREARSELENKLAQINGVNPRDRSGAQPRRGSTTREFGPILEQGETAYKGEIRRNN
jgi:hypothetical protein